MSGPRAGMRGAPISLRRSHLARSTSVDWAQTHRRHGPKTEGRAVHSATGHWSPPASRRSPPTGNPWTTPRAQQSPSGPARSPPRVEISRKKPPSTLVFSQQEEPSGQSVKADLVQHLSPTSPASSAEPSGGLIRKQSVRKTLSDSLSVGKLKQEEEADQYEDGSSNLARLDLRAEPKVGTTGGVSSSCPNLIDDEKVSMNPRIGASQSSEGMNRRSGASSAGSERARTNVLRVPNIFVTSFTHSSDHKSRDRVERSREVRQDSDNTRQVPILNAGLSTRRNYRHSAPELSGTRSPTRSYWDRLRETIKPSLKKSNSDTRPMSATTQPSSENVLESTRTQRLEPRMAKVLSYLYIGNLETSYDERLLCRIGIRSIIDLSDMAPEEVSSKHKIHSPCMCSQEARHLKATLRISLDETDTSDMESSFEQINKFIEGARNVNKKTLVVCWTGHSASAVAVMQYLIVHHGCNLRRAYSMVMRQGTDIELSPSHLLLLQTLERKTLPTVDQSRHLDLDQLKPNSTRLPREAWTSEESDT